MCSFNKDLLIVDLYEVLLQWRICLCPRFLGERFKTPLIPWGIGVSLLFIMGPWIVSGFMLRKWLRIGAGHARKNNDRTRSLGLWARWYHPNIHKEKGGRRLSSATWPIIQSIILQWKFWILMSVLASWLVNTLICSESDVSWFYVSRTVWKPPRLHPMYPS